MIHIYNTLTREKELFKPIQPNKVAMYVCGPTVYNYIHIGNARSIVAFDTIRRYLEYRGFEVNYVSNFTDVDDKMISAAKKDGISVQALADRFIQAFNEDTAALNIQPATQNPRATEYIPEIISFIKALIDQEVAYVVDGDVYYRTRKFAAYGHLSHQDIDQLEAGASQHVDAVELARKEDPIDFALWKAQKQDEIAWNAPWGKGRPGWHIECSVMATNELGDTIDIHGGGQDLEFPHHENEIAQSEAKTGQTFVNYWMHNGFVTVGNDEKMSKSLGNFVTVHDLLQQVEPAVLRFALATTQYRKPLAYSELTLTEAKNNLMKLKNAFVNLAYRQDTAEAGHDIAVETAAKASIKAFEDAMDDDFNVQNGITQIYELARQINIYAEEATVKRETVDFLMAQFNELLKIIGLDFANEATADAVDAEIEALVAERTAAKAAKDFAKSDAIRDQLQAQGIILEDTAQGTRWRHA